VTTRLAMLYLEPLPAREMALLSRPSRLCLLMEYTHEPTWQFDLYII